MWFLRFFIVLIFCITAAPSAYAMMITEIYYDPEGTDAGHEWIEIYNDSNESIDITGWKLFEANVNHGLTAYSGDTIINSGEYAIIADQPATVVNDFPEIATVFDSVFSLNNTGETIALKNQSLVVVDQIVYASTQGGSEDGNSLNMVNGSLVPRTPTPGRAAAAEVAPSETEEEEAAGTEDDTSDNTNTSSGTTTDAGSNIDENQTVTSAAASYNDGDASTKDPRYTVSLSVDTVISAHDPVAFEGIVKRDEAILLKGRFRWSLGDGTTFEKNKLVPFEYTYDTPGRYVVVLEYFRTYFDEKPLVRVQKTIRVISGDITITAVDTQGTITISNNEQSVIDLSGWRIVSAGTTFVFGDNTFILQGDTLAIPYRVHKLAVSPNSFVVLQKPDGVLVSRYPKPYHATTTTQEISNIESERMKIDTSQQASVAAIRVHGIWPWVIGLVVLVLCVTAACVVILVRLGKQTPVDRDDKDTGSQQHNFSSDDIELLM